MRKANTVYYCFEGCSRLTNNHATISELTTKLCRLCGRENKDVIRQELCRLKNKVDNEGYVYASTAFKLKGNSIENEVDFDNYFITENSEVVLYLSNGIHDIIV